MGATANQKKAIEVSGRPLFIQAGAGTGKTFTLANRLAYGLSEESKRTIPDVMSLLTITFTNKAAGELLGRVRAELRRRGLVQEALQVDAAWISTIHSMGDRILKTHAFEAGMDPGAALLTEQQSNDLLDGAVEVMFVGHRGDQDFERLLAELGSEPLARLVSRLALAVELAPEGTRSFDLGPEVGKAEPSFLTNLQGLFSDSKEKLEKLGVPKDKTKYVNNYEAISSNADHLAGCLKDAPRDLNWPYIRDCLLGCKPISGGKFTSNFAPIFKECGSSLLEAAVLVATNVAREQAETLLGLAGEVCEEHRRLKRGEGAVDTNDLLIETYRLLQREPDIAARYRKRFASIMVDEFQDTDRLQVEIVKMLCDDKLSVLTTVGDAQQSIYGFRGADLEVYREMRNDMAERDSVEVKLDMNFRSHADVLAFVEDIFSKPEFFGNEFLKVVPGSSNNRDQTWAAADDVRVKVLLSAGEVDPDNARKHTGTDALRRADAKALADEFERMHAAGAEYGDMAILMRSTKTSKSGPYLAELRSRGIPCVISGGSDFFTMPEVKAATMFLRFLADRDDDEALSQVLRSDFFCMGDADMLALASVNRYEIDTEKFEARSKTSLYDALCAVAQGFSQEQSHGIACAHAVLTEALCQAQASPLSVVVSGAVETSGWLADLRAAGVEGQAVEANLQRFCDMLDDFEKVQGRSPVRAALHFRSMGELAENGMGGRGKPGAMITNGNAAVQIMTIHASKGLEFPIVAVAEYESPTRGSGVELRTLTEKGKSYLSLSPTLLSPTLKDKAAKRFKTWEEELDSLASASDTASFSSRCARLGKQRSDEELQRLFYVALTRARDMLILVCHDGRVATKRELSSGLTADIFAAVFGDALPSGHAVVKTAAGAKVEFCQTNVPCSAPASEEDEADPQKRVHVVPGPAVVERPNSFIPRSSFIKSYSSIAAGEELFQEAPEANSIFLRTRSATETVSGIGSAFHLVAQWLAEIGGCKNGLKERIAAAARRYGLEGDAVERLRTAIESWVGSARFDQAMKSERRFSEHAFSVEVNGTALEGYIDLLCLDAESDSALVIDYKTGTSGDVEELEQRYALQARCYAYAVLYSQAASKVELVFVRPEVGMQEIVFEYAQDDMEDLAAAILGKA